MLRWAVTICLVALPTTLNGSPQAAVPGRYETEQDFTDSPDAKLVSSYPEIQTEKSAAAKQLAKQHKPRGRYQQPLRNEYPQQPQQYQSQEQYQQYQADYQAPVQPQSTSPPTPQYEHQQRNQYESQYISQAKYSQQTPHHEHRPTTTTYIPIIRLEKTQSLDGTYQQSWETGNNIIASENGYLKHIKDDQDALVQTGNYTYTAPDGSVVWTSYTADEGGFKVSGSHIPTPPPIPEEIRRGLQQIYEGIRLQQEAAAREAKSGKKKPASDEENVVTPENYPPQSDNYPPQYRYYQQQQQQQQQPQQPQQQQPRHHHPQQYSQQPQEQPHYQEQPQTYKPIVVQQPIRKVQKAQRPQNQQYYTQPQSAAEFPESQRIQQNQEISQPEQ